ncbi:MAG: AsnC family transcriptional regulator [Pseudomonadota bacterium]|nr:MAG: AsnC family transcriptional regulator [Pseudomonadota bacterium]
MDPLDRAIVNRLQDGFPVSERPYAEVAAELGTNEEELMRRIDALLAGGTLTRFGPMYHAERMGGALTLAAMQVPEHDFERVAVLVNAHPEVAHNYAREHTFNMWFVLATETPREIDRVIDAIERETGYRVYDMPKLEEFFVGLRFPV